MPNLSPLLLQAMLSCSLSMPDAAICCNSGTRADIALNKTNSFSKPAECVSKLATVLFPAETTGDAVGMIQHAAVPLLAIQVVWLHLEHQIKTMWFPSYKVEKSWGPSPPPRDNFPFLAPSMIHLIVPASSMFWQSQASM